MEKKEMLEKIKEVNPYIANKIKNRNKKLIEEGYNLLIKKKELKKIKNKKRRNKK